MVHQAFDKLDQSDDGKVTVEDLKGVYNVKKHPEVESGDKTEEEVLKQFLEVFEGGSEVRRKKNLYFCRKIQLIFFFKDEETQGDGKVRSSQHKLKLLFFSPQKSFLCIYFYFFLSFPGNKG